MPTDAQHVGYREVRRTIDRAVRWLVDVRFPISDVAAEIDRFKPTFDALARRCRTCCAAGSGRTSTPRSTG